MIKKLLFIGFILIVSIGFAQVQSIEKVGVSPNPFSQKTTITFTSHNKQNIYFSVRSILGKTVYTKKITAVNGKNKIPFSKNKLASGIYLYTIQSSTKRISKRFVIK